jgi:hypothetical protein
VFYIKWFRPRFNGWMETSDLYCSRLINFTLEKKLKNTDWNFLVNKIEKKKWRFENENSSMQVVMKIL